MAAPIAAAWAVEEYKDLDTFVADAIVAAPCIYVVSFDYYKMKVVEAFMGIDLRRITPIGRVDKEESVEDEMAEGAVEEGRIDIGAAVVLDDHLRGCGKVEVYSDLGLRKQGRGGEETLRCSNACRYSSV